MAWGVVFVEANPPGLADLSARAGNTIALRNAARHPAYLAAGHSPALTLGTMS